MAKGIKNLPKPLQTVFVRGLVDKIKDGDIVKIDLGDNVVKNKNTHNQLKDDFIGGCF